MKYNIVFATDEGYVQHLAVAIKSLLENNSDLELDIYLINGGLNNNVYSKLTRMIKS